MDDLDLRVRNSTYRAFVELGRAPTAAEVAERIDVAADEASSSWRRLHDAHALVLDPSGLRLRMANPFSAVPTPYRVRAQDRWWFGNCAWDAVGICAALGVDGRIDTSCPDCGDPIRLEIRGEHPADRSLLFHCLVPAAHWWDDIEFT